MTEMHTVDRDAALAAAIDFALHQLEDTPLAFQEAHRATTGADPEDRWAPFLSEAMLYPLVGKEDARTLMARFRQLVSALGVSEGTWRRMLYDAHRARVRIRLEVRPPEGAALPDAKAVRQRVAADLGTLADPLRGQARALNSQTDPGVVYVELTPGMLERMVQPLEAAGYRLKTSQSRIMSRRELEGQG